MKWPGASLLGSASDTNILDESTAARSFSFLSPVSTGSLFVSDIKWVLPLRTQSNILRQSGLALEALTTS